MKKFKPNFKFDLSTEQKDVVDKLEKRLKTEDDLVLLGATGTGKTFSIANLILRYNKPALILAHNKTLANQLYAEIKEMFPNNRVEYYISNFDYYKPEAFVPQTNTYIDKQSIQNSQIELMRNSTLSSLTSRDDVIVVSSVAAIYGHRSPEDYKKAHYEVRKDTDIDRDDLLHKLVNLGYKRTSALSMGTFVVRGDVIEISPSWSNEYHIRIELFGTTVEQISEIDGLNKTKIKNHDVFILFPADPYVIEKNDIKSLANEIKRDLAIRLKELKKAGKDIEHQRLEQRVNFDIEQIEQTGITSGIENYSLYFDKGRKPTEPPYTLLDYFPKDFLMIFDESHMSVPQLGAMYKGDRSRKETLVEYGFRLPSALDNRPLKFAEAMGKMTKRIYVSATPGEYEMNITKGKVVEQIIRPTGLVDPIIETRSSNNQLENLLEELQDRKDKNERVLINTISRKLAENIADYYKDRGFSVAYLHFELTPFERDEVLRKLRLGFYDAVIGINLLREGLDLPEVSLIAILDADSEGFLRDRKSLLQMVGRVSRHLEGRAIFYSSKITSAMKETIDETNRRREIQLKHNKDNNITPRQIIKPIPNPIMEEIETKHNIKLSTLKYNEKLALLKKEMNTAAKEYNFEEAIKYRDMVISLEKEHGK